MFGAWSKSSVVAVVLCVCVGIVVLAIEAVRATRARRRKRAAILHACRPGVETMSVIIVCPPWVHYGHVVESLRDAVQHAACPLRLGLVVMQYVDDEVPALSPVLDSALQALNLGPMMLKEQLRVLRMTRAEWHGFAHSLDQALTFMVQNESLVVTLAPGAKLVPNWDVSATMTVGSLSPGCVLSCPSAPSPTDATFSFLASHRTIGVATMRPGTGSGTPPAIPALTWTHAFSCCATKTLRSVIGAMLDKPRHPSGPDLDWWCTKQLVGKVFHPTWPCTWSTHEYNAGDVNEDDTPLTPFVASYLGVVGKQLEARARLGLTPGPNDPHELAAKIGSQTDVMRALSRIKTARDAM